MNTLFSVLSLLTYIKGLGGSFNSLFIYFGVGDYHGPTLGFLLGSFLSLYFLTSLERRHADLHSIPLNRKGENTFCLFFLLMLSFGMVFHTQAVLKTPINIARADMLPAIQAQIHTALKGESPYKPILNADGSVILHGYLPMLWLSYLPFEILHFDLRWMNLLAQLVFYLLLLNCYLRYRGPWPSRFWASGSLLFSMVAIHLFSKQGIRGPIDLHTGPFWLFSALFYWAVLTHRIGLSLWLAPLMVLCREPAILLVIPYVFHLFFRDRRQFYRGILIGPLVGLMITGPFLLSAPSDFFRGIFFYAHHLYQTPLSDMLKFYGFSGVLYKLDILGWQQPLQLIGTVVAVGIALVKRNTLTPVGSLALGAIAYLNIIVFASLSYQFLYIELIQLLLLINVSTCKPVSKFE